MRSVQVRNDARRQGGREPAELLSGGTGRRRIDNTRRRLLLTDLQKQCASTAGSRWYMPGYVCEYCQELAAGETVVIDSSTLMCALLHADLPGIDDYAFRGRHCGKQFL